MKEVARNRSEIGRKRAGEAGQARSPAPEAVIVKEREKLEGYAEAKALIEQRAVIRRNL